MADEGIKTLIKEAEQQVLNRTKFYVEMFKLLDSLTHIGNNLCREHVGRTEYFEGLSAMRRSINAEFSRSIEDLYSLAGVGGSEASQAVRDTFLEIFPERDEETLKRFMESQNVIINPWWESEQID